MKPVKQKNDLKKSNLKGAILSLAVASLSLVLASLSGCHSPAQVEKRGNQQTKNLEERLSELESENQALKAQLSGSEQQPSPISSAATDQTSETEVLQIPENSSGNLSDPAAQPSSGQENTKPTLSRAELEKLSPEPVVIYFPDTGETKVIENNQFKNRAEQMDYLQFAKEHEIRFDSNLRHLDEEGKPMATKETEEDPYALKVVEMDAYQASKDPQRDPNYHPETLTLVVTEEPGTSRNLCFGLNPTRGDRLQKDFRTLVEPEAVKASALTDEEKRLLTGLVVFPDQSGFRFNPLDMKMEQLASHKGDYLLTDLKGTIYRLSGQNEFVRKLTDLMNQPGDYVCFDHRDKEQDKKNLNPIAVYWDQIPVQGKGRLAFYNPTQDNWAFNGSIWIETFNGRGWVDLPISSLSALRLNESASILPGETRVVELDWKEATGTLQRGVYRIRTIVTGSQGLNSIRTQNSESLFIVP